MILFLSDVFFRFKEETNYDKNQLDFS